MNGITLLFFLIGIGGLLVLHYRLSPPEPEYEQKESDDAREDEAFHERLSDVIERIGRYPGRLWRAVLAYLMATNLSLPDQAAEAEQKRDGKDKSAPAYDLPDAGLRDLIQDGKIDAAVDAYKLFTGVDQYTARDAILQIEREIRLAEDEPADIIRIPDDRIMKR